MSAFPSNPFSPAPAAVANANFQQGAALPPTGWQLGGPALGSSVAVTWDTATQYAGIQSPILTATAKGSGITSSSAIPVSPNQLLTLGAALMSVSGDPVVVQVSWFDSNLNFISGGPALSSTATSWQYLATISFPVPANAVVAYVQCYMNGASGGTGEVAAISVGTVSALQYYLSLVTSKWRGAPNFNAWLTALLLPIIQAGICASTMYWAFDLMAGAVGEQLDVLGQILGQVRQVNLVTSAGGGIVAVSTTTGHTGSGYAVNDVLGVVQGGASGGTVKIIAISPHGYPPGFCLYSVVTPGTGYSVATGLATTGGSGTGMEVNISAVTVPTSIPTLGDNDYRNLLLATVVRNNWNGQQDSLYAYWNLLFPGTSIAIQDNMDMTANVFITGNFSATMLALITGGLIVPRPQGVQYNYIFNLPTFGCDLNNALVAGVDVGFIA